MASSNKSDKEKKKAGTRFLANKARDRKKAGDKFNGGK